MSELPLGLPALNQLGGEKAGSAAEAVAVDDQDHGEDAVGELGEGEGDHLVVHLKGDLSSSSSSAVAISPRGCSQASEAAVSIVIS